MLERLKTLLFGKPGGEAGPVADEELRLAAAVLLVEAARMDAAYELAERRIIAAVLRRHFRLDELETAALLEMAERVQRQSTELSRFAKTIKDRYGPEQRISLMEMLWEVVYADGELHDFEANLMRRIGGLLYVSDQERGQARKRVMKRLDLTPGEKEV